MAVVQAKMCRSSLKAMVSSPVCDEEENSDLDSSCSTLSVDESENSPPQSQVTPVMLKRTTSTGFTPSVVAVVRFFLILVSLFYVEVSVTRPVFHIWYCTRGFLFRLKIVLPPS